MKNYLLSLIAVIVLALIAYVGAEAATWPQYVFGIIIPYLAMTIFIMGTIRKILGWARSPVPFRIPSTCGQQKSLPWIKQSKIDNPFTFFGVIVRMVLEVFLFRSLFRNTKCKMSKGGKIFFDLEKWLWVGAIVFHWSFLVVLLRHLRFFTNPVPGCIQFLEQVDGFIQIGLPGIFLSGFALVAGAVFLLVRRIVIPQVRYISLASDYFPLFLIIGIALTGILMRYFTKVDIVGAKEILMGLVTFHPSISANINGIFYVHLFLVSILLVYIPFSKLMHMGGIFFSPTRNLANNSRAVRHINPWNYPVKVHTYDEYEDDYREKMIEAGLPVEKE
ncbi:MAG: sulfate reduction electron transfer complex DsrMKJOP subunit DsrM [Desulfobacterales bacterium]|nr:sulfate reduction electron transfer complex DsrMKJOP subunit DsrM [Desulfobacterales bacterium]